jgi:protein-S-isoprenylcysteine O-methyltransferase Ste14
MASESTRAGTFNTAVALDLFERAVVLSFYAFLFSNMLPAFLANGDPADLIVLLSEGMVVFFILIRRTTSAVSFRLLDWSVALGGTAAALLVKPTLDGGSVVPIAFSALLMLAGLVLQVSAKLFLNRRFGLVAANRGVMIAGPYRLVRHPMYAGYLLTFVGFWLANPSLWNFAIYLIAISALLYRVQAEEKILGRDPAYREFAVAVPYRLVPRVF